MFSNLELIKRAVVIYCCRDGTISYEPRNAKGKIAKPFNGVAIPVYSVDSVAEARELQILACRLERIREPRKSYCVHRAARYNVTHEQR